MPRQPQVTDRRAHTDATATLKSLEQRVFRLELDKDEIPVFNNGIILGDGKGTPIVKGEGTTTTSSTVTGAVSTAPTSLVMTPGANQNIIYVDISWSAPSNVSNVKDYEVEIWKTGSPSRFVYTAGLSVRVEPLEPNVTYNVRVRSISKTGVGGPYVTGSFSSGIDSTVPATVTGLTVSAGFRSIIATWTEVADADVKNGNGTYELDVATNAGFSVGLRTFRESGTITAATDLVTGTLYYCRVRAIDASGNAGPYSTTASATTQSVQTADYANLSIVNAAIANATIDNAKIASLDAAKINTGFLDAARIQTNTLTADKIATGTLTSTTITLSSTGVLQAGSTGSNGFVLDSTGLKFYAGGVNTIFLRADGGTATFTGTISASTVTGTTITGGTIRTASSGQRVAIEGASIDRVKWYTGASEETATATINVGSGGSGGGGTAFGELGISSPSFGSGFANIALRSATNSGGTGAHIALTSNYLRFNAEYADLQSTFYFRTAQDDIFFKVFGAFANPAEFQIARRTNETSLIIKEPNSTDGFRLRIQNGDGQVMSVIATDASAYIPIYASAFTVASSRTTKRNIENREEAVLTRVQGLQPVTFDRDHDPHTRLGLIAEDVAKLFPECVTNKGKAIDLNALVVTTIQAIKELTRKVETLESRS